MQVMDQEPSLTLRLIAVIIVGLCIGPQVGHGQFETRHSIARTMAPADPGSVMVTDLNSDGAKDIVWVAGGELFSSEYVGAVASLPTPLATSTDIQAAVIGDLDGDGHPDIAATTVGYGLVRFMNDGTGTLLSAQTVVPANMNVYHIAPPADLDGDLDLDLVYSGYQFGIYWCRNLGGGMFDTPVHLTDTLGAGPVLADDIDGDGDSDVLWRTFAPSKVHGSLNIGGGVFLDPIVIASLSGSITDLDLVDLDTNGYKDLFFAMYQDTLILLPQTAPFVFGLPQLINGPTNVKTVVISDANADGMKDVLLSTQGPYVIRWYLNDGAGDLGPAFIVDTLITAVELVSEDLDMNGTRDVLAVSGINGNGHLDLWLGTAGLVYERADRIDDRPGCVDDFEVMDVDGDGSEDLVTLCRNDFSLAWYKMVNGISDGQIRVTSYNDWGGQRMDQADVDLDGTLDLLYFNKFPGDAAVMIAKNNGIGSGFHAAVRNTSIPDPVVHAMFANVNSDGYPDILLVLYNSSSLYWMRNNGSGSFLAALPLYATPSNLTGAIGADVDGDGDQDLIITLTTGAVLFSEQTAPGVFGSAVMASPTAHGVAGIIDFDCNADGWRDIAIVSVTDGHVRSFQSMGSAGLAPGVTVDNTLSSPDRVVALHLDANADQDLLAYASNSWTMRYYQNTGQCSFAPGVDIEPSISTLGISAVDLDNDMLWDIVVYDAAEGELLWLENRMDEVGISDPVDAVGPFIFPTPFIDQLVVSLGHQGAVRARLYSILGVELDQARCSPCESVSFNTGGLAPGNYVVQVITEGASPVRQVVTKVN